MVEGGTAGDGRLIFIICDRSTQQATLVVVVVVIAIDVAVAIVVVMASKIPINARYSISFHYVPSALSFLSLPFSNINR